MTETRWKRNSRFIDRNIDGEAIILDLKTGVYYSLNEVGTAVWEKLKDCATTSELEADITAGYDIPVETAQSDIEELLNDLAAEGLISKED